MLNLSGPGYLKNVKLLLFYTETTLTCLVQYEHRDVNYIIIGTNLDLEFYSLLVTHHIAERT